METKTPFMLLFVYNGTDQGSVISDTKHMLDLALDDIEEHGMLPQEFETKDVPHFTLRLNVPRLPATGDNKSSFGKGIDHFKEHGKKAFHFEAAKEDTKYFKFLSGHANQMKLEAKFCGKFAKYTATLGNAGPLSNCTRLCRCIQGHLHYHLSSTSITLNGIDMLDTSENIGNPTGKSIICLTVQDLLYRITLESKSPLFLQLSQCPTGEVDAVIPNMAEAEVMAERMNTQIAVWCHFYWKDVNPGAEKFYHKLSKRAFSQILWHKISACSWDPVLKAVATPRGQSEMALITEFEQLEWVKTLTQETNSTTTKKTTHNENSMAFNFQDDFSVGTIRGTNAKTTSKDLGEPATAAEVVELEDDNDDVSVLTTKTTGEIQNNVSGSRAASGSTSVDGPGANSSQPETGRGGLPDPANASLTGGGARGASGK